MEKFNFSQSYSSISNLLKQDFEGFIPSTIAFAQTAKFCYVVPDVKYSREIPVVDYSTFNVANSVTASPFSDTITQTISSVQLVSGSLKFENSYNLSEMERFYYGNYMKRGSDQQDLPFAQYFLEHMYKKAAERLDVFFWSGTSGVNGVLPQLDSTGTTAATILTGQSFAVSTGITHGVIATFDNMVNNLDAAFLGEELVIFTGVDVLKNYIQSLRNLNLFHYNPNDVVTAAVTAFGYPNIKIVGTAGLNGRSRAVLVKPEYLMWGTDLLPEEEPIQAEYNMYLDRFLTRYKFKLAAGIAFPSKAILAK